MASAATGLNPEAPGALGLIRFIGGTFVKGNIKLCIIFMCIYCLHVCICGILTGSCEDFLLIPAVLVLGTGIVDGLRRPDPLGGKSLLPGLGSLLNAPGANSLLTPPGGRKFTCCR